MKTEPIQNQYDGPLPPAKHRAGGTISLDYANSRDAGEMDRGIRETIRGIRMSILAMGIALARFKARGLFADLRFHSMNDYLESLCDDMQIERSTAHNWLYIGEAWLKYRRDLERVGFSDGDGPTKLPYVDRALAVYPKKDVFRAVKEMSLRQFISFSRREAPAPPPEPDIRVRGNQVFVGKKLAVTLADGLDPVTRDYLAGITAEAGKALEAGEVLFTTRLYDMDELRRFGRAAERLKKELRSGIRGKG